VLTGPRQGQQFQLRGTMRIGRTEDNEIALDDRKASHRHAAISREASGYILQDLHSTNGTYLNGQRIDEPCSLKEGDRILVGNSTLVFRQDPFAAPTPPLNGIDPTTSAPWQSPPGLAAITPQPEVRERLPGRKVVLGAGLVVLVAAILAVIIYVALVRPDRAAEEALPPLVTRIVTETPSPAVAIVATDTPAVAVATDTPAVVLATDTPAVAATSAEREYRVLLPAVLRDYATP
jgi:hypothetical protein